MVPSSWSTNGCGSSSSDPQSSTQCIESLLPLLASTVAANELADTLLRDPDSRQARCHHVAEAGGAAGRPNWHQRDLHRPTATRALAKLLATHKKTFHVPNSTEVILGASVESKFHQEAAMSPRKTGVKLTPKSKAVGGSVNSGKN